MSIQKNRKNLSKPIKNLTRTPSKSLIRPTTPTQSLSIPTVEEVSTQINLDNQEAKQGLQDILDYNENIQNHLPCYKNFKPLNKVLLRIYRRLPLVMENGLIVDIPNSTDFAQITKTAGSGQKYNLQEMESQFRFDKRAIIVSAPERFGLPEGQEVEIKDLLVKGEKYEDTSFLIYEGAFVHSSSNLPLPPDDCNNPHYGYALLHVDAINGWNED